MYSRIKISSMNMKLFRGPIYSLINFEILTILTPGYEKRIIKIMSSENHGLTCL